MLGEGMCSWLCQGSESARGLAETGWVLGGVGVGEMGWGHRKLLDPLWMDRQPAWRTDTSCLEAALDGQTVAMLGGSHGHTGTMRGGQTGTVLGGQTHCLGTLTFSELIASLWENTAEEHSAC